MAKVKSIQELIAMKDALNDSRNEILTYYSKSLDTEIKFKKATRVEAIQAQEMDRADIDPYLIYSHVVEPDLKDKQLQESFNAGCEPFKIIDKLLPMQEVGELSLAIIGQLKGDLVKDVKNL